MLACALCAKSILPVTLFSSFAVGFKSCDHKHRANVPVLFCLMLCNVAQSWKGRAQHPEKNPDILLRTVEMEVAVSPAVTVRAKPVNLHTHHKNMDNIARLWKWIWYWKRIRKLLAACRFSVRWLHSELLAETTVAIVDTRCEQVLKVSRLHPTLLNRAKPGNSNSSEKWQSIHVEDKDEILENMVLKLWWFSKKEGHTLFKWIKARKSQ